MEDRLSLSGAAAEMALSAIAWRAQFDRVAGVGAVCREGRVEDGAAGEDGIAVGRGRGVRGCQWGRR
jgi:hypothetical protein